MIPELTAEWLRMKFGLPPEAAVRAADELMFRLGLRKEFGVVERGEPEPTWLSDYRDLPVRDGELLMVRWKSEWKADNGG